MKEVNRKDRFGLFPTFEASHNDVPPAVCERLRTPALITTRKENHKKPEKRTISDQVPRPPSTFVEITETPNDLSGDARRYP